MDCANCGRDNPLDAAYCGECGERLQGDAGVVTAMELDASITAGRRWRSLLYGLVSAVALTSGASPVSGTLQTRTMYAGFWVRFLAWIIDLAILWIGAALFFHLTSLHPSLFAMTYLDSRVAGFFAGIVLLVPYRILLTSLRGQTIGKMALGIRVVNEKGVVPHWSWILLRETLARFISTLFFFLGYIFIAGDREKQGWHDKMARTHVVRKTQYGADIEP